MKLKSKFEGFQDPWMANGGVMNTLGTYVHIIILYPLKNGVWAGWMRVSDFLIYYLLCSYISDGHPWWW